MNRFAAETVTGIASVRVNPLPLTAIDKPYCPAAVLCEVLRVRVVDDPAAKVVDDAVGVIPVGAPVTERPSGSVKVPDTEPQDTWTLAACPAVTVTLLGFADSVQLGGTLTTNETDAVRVTPPPLAVTVTGYEPAFTLVATVNVRVLPAVAAAVADENAAVTPVGKPAAEKLTEALNPFCGVVDTTI